MKRYTVTFPDELMEKLDRERRRLDVSRSEVVRRALALHFAKRRQERGEELRPRDIAALEDERARREALRDERDG